MRVFSEHLGYTYFTDSFSSTIKIFSDNLSENLKILERI